MNWDRIEGNWKQFKGKVKEHWGKLTDDQLDIIDGKREQLAGRVQETYGISKEDAEKQIRLFEELYDDWTPDVVPPPRGDRKAPRQAKGH
jgi:uncharacterized protein YjbJ (UPF0337 family)